MEQNKLEKRKHNRQMVRRNESSIGDMAWKILGGALLAVTVAAIVVSLPDIKRYIKISTM